jgi:hypothetical protein
LFKSCKVSNKFAFHGNPLSRHNIPMYRSSELFSSFDFILGEQSPPKPVDIPTLGHVADFKLALKEF